MKINTGSISGFDAMSVEDKLKALLELDMPEPDYSGYVTKETFDKKAAEASSYSKKLRERMTDEEAAAQSQKEAMDALQKQLSDASDQIAALTREKTVSKLTADYIAQGYEKDLAAKAAEALCDGKTDQVMEYASQHLAAHDKSLRAELMKSNPTPPGSAADSEVPANVVQAKAFGAAKAESLKASNDILAQYVL